MTPYDLANVVERTGRLSAQLDKHLADLTRDVQRGLLGLVRLQLTIPADRATGKIASSGVLTPEGERLVQQLAAANCALTEAIRTYAEAVANVGAVVLNEIEAENQSTEPRP